MNLANLARFVIRHPASLGILAAKLRSRLAPLPDAEQVKSWTAARSQRSGDLAERLAPELWAEAGDFAEALEERARALLPAVPFDMGGGGDHRFLFWLTRFLRPRVAVETGVAAGWSSAAILEALHRNRRGHLFSSDFPYFRVKDPERFIGILVRPELRERWTLLTRGDRKALPDILRRGGPIDLFHYDSDKRPSGRAFAMNSVLPRLSPGGVAIMDDILNDDWFMRFAESRAWRCSVLDGRAGLVRAHAAVPLQPTQAPASLRQ